MARQQKPNTDGAWPSQDQRSRLAAAIDPWWRRARIAVFPIGLAALCIALWLNRHEIMAVLG